ncbi:hypothetical protein FQR65_LT07876 [Abscondita terminalis]|nr:hypothetical protein FQR65_LT07876 [Abscondita terminalis]
MASKLSQMQARFQQKQMQEKEEKLLRLYESQQQRAIERVNRGSAGSNTSATSTTTVQRGKVRQMFDERRQKAGIDRSYPLEPLRIAKTNGYNDNGNLDNSSSKIVIKQTIKKDTLQVKNGKPIVNKRETIRSVYNNNNGDESFEEQTFTDSPSRPILNRTYRRKDLEMMMREHSINPNIDDEEFPDVDIDEFEDPSPNPILSNVRSVSPVNQNRMLPKTIVRNSSGDNTPKKEAKPLVRKPLTKTVKNSPPKEVVPSKSFTPPSPIRSAVKMSTPATPSRGCAKPSESRVPSTVRSSSKQGQRGPSSVTRDDLQACKYCNRRFLEDRLGVHEDICSKTLKKKRKVYDATKHRVTGTELEPYTRKMNKPCVQKVSLC